MSKLLHSETICCGHKRCPTVCFYEDGTLSIHDDVEGTFTKVTFTAEQAARLRELLSVSPSTPR